MLYIYGERTPTFEELSKELVELARHKHYADDTWLDRLTYLGKGLRLRKAAYWHRFTPLNFASLTYRHVLWRVAPRFACAFLALVWLVPSGPRQTSGILPAVVLATLLFAAAWSPIALASASWTLAWAERFRKSRQEVERQLRSPEGLRGWRAVPAQDGGWELAPTRPTHQDGAAV